MEAARLDGQLQLVLERVRENQTEWLPQLCVLVAPRAKEVALAAKEWERVRHLLDR